MVQKMMKNVLFIIVSHLVLIGYDVSATPYWPGALENFNAEVSAVAGTPFKELTGKYMKRHKLWWKNGKFCHSKKPDKSIFVANLSSATNYWHDDSTSRCFRYHNFGQKNSTNVPVFVLSHGSGGSSLSFCGSRRFLKKVMALKAAIICTTHSGAITANNRYEVPKERLPTQTLNCTDADTAEWVYFAHILSWIRAQKAHQHGKIILAGFSQGGALTSYLADCFSQLIAGYSMLGAGLQLSSKDHGYAKPKWPTNSTHNLKNCMYVGRREAKSRFEKAWHLIREMERNGQPYAFEATQNETHAPWPGWIPSMAKCLCLDSSCEPSGPDYSDPKQVGDIDFLVRKTQLRSCAAHWIQAGVPGCSNLSVLAARVPCRVPNTTTDRNLRGKKRHHKNRTRCLVSD